MTRGLLVTAAVLACLAGVYLVAMRAARSTIELANGEPAAGGLREPEIVLRDVEVREIREDGRSFRLVSDNAAYSVLSKKLSAAEVSLTLREGVDRIVVRAPQARWSMEEGSMELPEGGAAETAAGWTAAVPEAHIDLKAQVMTAQRASMSIPGVRIEGDNLVWRWQEGSVTLDAPKSRVLPGKLGAGGGRGGADE